jgi:hypothetical protein
MLYLEMTVIRQEHALKCFYWRGWNASIFCAANAVPPLRMVLQQSCTVMKVFRFLMVL